MFEFFWIYRLDKNKSHIKKIYLPLLIDITKISPQKNCLNFFEYIG
jgi:hypothetical protein